MQNIKILLKMFPYIKDKTKLLDLRIDNESLSLISFRDVANKISSIIINHVVFIEKDIDDIVITDATAGVGGDTISFAMNFNYVNAIELDSVRCEYLINNLSVYNLKNVNVIQGDCIEKLKQIELQDIVFIDPPWGGKKYKVYKKLNLSISDISLEDLCNEILFSSKYKANPKMIVLKVPLNYNIDDFKNTIYEYCNINNNNCEIYTYILKKMIIIVLLKKK